MPKLHKNTFTLPSELMQINHEKMMEICRILQEQIPSDDDVIFQFAKFLVDRGINVQMSEYIPKGTIIIGTGQKNLWESLMNQ